MGRRVLAFFLGMLVGIVFVFGAVGLAIYITATVVKPSDIYPDSNKYLGDLADKSLYDMYKSIAELYREKVGIQDDDGMYFTFGQFCEHYNINPNELFGKEVSQDILDIPMFEFFGDNKDPAMQQVKVSAFFSLVNLITSNPDGTNYFFTQKMIEKLAKHNMAELSEDEKGFPYVFDRVLLVDVMPSAFPEEKEADNVIMWALGQTSVGRLMGGFEGNVLLQFKEGGAFETMGSLKMKELVGEGSGILNALFKDNQLADLIDDDGSINIDGLTENMYVGELLEYKRNALDEESLQGFTVKFEEDDRAILSRGEGDEEELVIRIPISDEGEYRYYETKFICTVTEHSHEDCEQSDDGYLCGQQEHVHNAYCYGFVWYNCQFEDGEHTHGTECLATGIMGKLANEKVSELRDLNDTIMSFTLYDVMGNDVPPMLKSIQNTKLRDLNRAIDKMYLGDFLEYTRFTTDGLTEIDNVNLPNGVKQYVNADTGETLLAKRDEQDGNWYVARLDCANDEHTDADHTLDCYDFIWYAPNDGEEGVEYEEVTGVMGRLASIPIGELSASKLTKLVDDTKLGEVIDKDTLNGNALLKELADVRIGSLSKELNALYVGSAMGYSREEATGDFGGHNRVDGTNCVYQNVNDGVKTYVKLDQKKNKYYNAQLNCTKKFDEQHPNHDDSCYGYVWYNCNVEPDTDHTHVEECVVKGLNSKMSNLTMDELANGELTKIFTSLTVWDAIESGMISFDGETETFYKYAIICCEDNHECSLTGYFEYYAAQMAQNKTPLASEYWHLKHDSLIPDEDDQIAHRDEWMNLPLTTFIGNILSAF